MPDETTLAPYGTGICSVCGREMTLTKKGVRLHVEARREAAEHIRGRCNDYTVPSRFRREGVLLAADWLDGGQR